jgi:hypothetical protein
VRLIIDNLNRKYGYTEQGAGEVCIYAIDNDIARVFAGSREARGLRRGSRNEERGPPPAAHRSMLQLKHGDTLCKMGIVHELFGKLNVFGNDRQHGKLQGVRPDRLFQKKGDI